MEPGSCFGRESLREKKTRVSERAISCFFWDERRRPCCREPDGRPPIERSRSLSPTLAMSAPTSLCRDVASTTPSLDRPQTKDDRGALQSPGLAERGHRKREKDAPTTSRKTCLFHRQARSSPRLSFLHDALHDDFTLRSVVTVVANSCPPTHSVTIEEADRGLSGGSILFPFSRREKEKRIERLSLSRPLLLSCQALAFRALLRKCAVRERKNER